MALADLLRLAIRSVAFVPSLLNAQRLVLGEPTEHVATEYDPTGFVRAVADDPEAKELACRLLERLAEREADGLR